MTQISPSDHHHILLFRSKTFSTLPLFDLGVEFKSNQDWRSNKGDIKRK
jgi:hypothetical protein